MRFDANFSADKSTSAQNDTSCCRNGPALVPVMRNYCFNVNHSAQLLPTINWNQYWERSVLQNHVFSLSFPSYSARSSKSSTCGTAMHQSNFSVIAAGVTCTNQSTLAPFLYLVLSALQPSQDSVQPHSCLKKINAENVAGTSFGPSASTNSTILSFTTPASVPPAPCCRFQAECYPDLFLITVILSPLFVSSPLQHCSHRAN